MMDRCQNLLHAVKKSTREKEVNLGIRERKGDGKTSFFRCTHSYTVIYTDLLIKTSYSTFHILIWVIKVPTGKDMVYLILTS